MKKLSGEETAKLVDAFSGYRIYSLAAMVIIVLGVILTASVNPQIGYFVPLIFVVLLSLTVLISTVIIYRKLSSLNLPANYNKTFWLSSALQYFGFIFLFATMVSRYF